MSTEWRSTEGPVSKVIINYDEPQSKPPPLLEVGAVAWIRKNLFGSVMDAFLTVFGTLFVVFVVTGSITWYIQGANWFVVTANFRQLMVGSFEPEYEWRLILFLLFVAVATGVTVAAYVRRLGPRFIALLLVVFIPVFVFPFMIDASVDLPVTYFTAGNLDIVSGSVTEVPQDQLAFIAKEGEEITIGFASSFMATDGELSKLHGFMDASSNTLRNAAKTRLDNIARAEELQILLADDQAEIESGQELGLLTENQRNSYTDELAGLVHTPNEEEQTRVDEITALLADETLDDEARTTLETELTTLQTPPSMVETYGLGTVSVHVEVLNVDVITNEADEQILETSVVFEGIVSSDGEAVSFTVPDDGWYIWNKEVQEGEGLAVLEVRGIYPIFRRDTKTRDFRFDRATDRFSVSEQQPELDAQAVDFVDIIRNQYRGDRTFNTYLRVYLAPFLNKIQIGSLMLLAAAIVGYLAARVADQYQPRPQDGRALTPYSRRTSTWMLMATPLLMFILINGLKIFGIGFEYTDPSDWGGLLLAMILTVFGIMFAFPLGLALALGRRSQLPAVKAISTLFIELVRGSPFITVLFMMQLMIPLVNPSLADIPNAYRALFATIIFIAAYLAENVRGGLQSLPPGQEEAAKALGLSNFQATIYITLPQALRAVIPALVGQFISLFKDTSLVAIVGLIDLVGIVNSTVAQAAFIGTRAEGYLFISVIYFVVSYIMSYISRQIEASGSGAARRI